jgi:hypothetical protein
MPRSTTMRHTLLVALALGLASSVPAAAELAVAATDAAPPDGVSAAIRDAVGAGSLEVTDGGADVAEFWLRDELPTKNPPSDTLGVSFGGLESGELVGVLRLARPWRDYKNLAVPAGVYTLRYAVRPADGNHMGVSTYRDFLLLTPAADDTAVAGPGSTDELYARSMKATGQPHPATLGLFPIWDPVKAPAIVKNDADQPTLAVPVGGLVLGLVIEGHGQV